MDLERIGVTNARELLSWKCYHVGHCRRMAVWLMGEIPIREPEGTY
jgi:hypothetical protein